MCNALTVGQRGTESSRKQLAGRSYSVRPAAGIPRPGLLDIYDGSAVDAQ